MFKIVGKDGKVTYSDVPAAANGGDVQSLRPDGRQKPAAQTKAEKDYATAREDIGLARKHVPNLAQYLEYLEMRDDAVSTYTPEK
jgi:hypothetical protein